MSKSSFDSRRRERRWPALLVTGLAVALIGAGLLVLAWSLGRGRAAPVAPTPSPTPAGLEPDVASPATATIESAPASSPAPTATYPAPQVQERLVPTPTPAPVTAGPTPGGTAAPFVLPTGTPTDKQATPLATAARDTWRIGVVAPRSDVDRYDVERLGAAWYVTGLAERTSSSPPGMQFVPLVQVLGASLTPGAERLAELARAEPGLLWLVGNEPDVIWQDNATPEEYAQVYHDVYTALKDADPTCQVAIGAISQVTPLRLRYLDAALAAYQARYGRPMEVDVWNIHLAILREERGSWGVDIPPGLPDDWGTLHEIGDNADADILRQEVLAFRRWMADRGLRDRPLIVTEFSVLMPPDYGFPPDRVEAFMRSALDFLLSAEDTTLGYPADGNRLVQRCAWYSVADRVHSTGNLFDVETGQITPLGLAFADYVAGR